MAAGTASTTLAGYGSYVFNDLVRKAARVFFGGATKPARSFIFTSGSQTIATTHTETADDRLHLFKFPDNCGEIYLEDFAITVSDCDTHATPTWVFDVVSFDTADVDVYISGSTVGQAGGTDEMDANTGFRYKQNVAGKYLTLKTTTGSATAAAGTATVRGKIWVGPRVELS